MQFPSTTSTAFNSPKFAVPSAVNDVDRVKSTHPDLPDLVIGMCTSGFDTLHSHFNSYKKLAVFAELALDIANYRANTQEDENSESFCKKTKLGSVIIRDINEGGNDSGVSIKVHGHERIFPGVSLRELQKKLRQDIVENSEMYSNYTNDDAVNSVRQRVAFDDLGHGLVSGVCAMGRPSSERAASFVTNCKPILAALIESDGNGQGSVRIDLDNPCAILTLTEIGDDVELDLEGERIRIKDQTFATICATLSRDNQLNSSFYGEDSD